MAGSGVAVRLHEFRESQDSRWPDGPKPSRPGRDVRGLYPGQLGRVHIVHSKDCGYSRRSQSLQESLRPPNPPCEDHRQSFDVCALRAVTVLHHGPAVLQQRPPQTVYQEQFGLRSPLCPR